MQNPSDANDDALKGLTIGPNLKKRVLKILIDYRDVSGNSWEAIASEILRVAGASPTQQTQLLTRQDLYAWFKGRSEIGNSKFKWILRFLLNPATIERPEFARARYLKPHYRTRFLGAAISEFYTSWISPPYFDTMGMPFETSDESQPNLGRLMRSAEGMYFSWTDGRSRQHGGSGEIHSILHCERYESTEFFLAHYFKMTSGRLPSPTSWRFNRYSGFATASTRYIRFHLKGALRNDPLIMYGACVFADPDRPATNLILGSEDLVSTVMFDDHPGVGGKALQLRTDYWRSSFQPNIKVMARLDIQTESAAKKEFADFLGDIV